MPATVVNAKYEQFDVYVGRPSAWGNPFMVGLHGDKTQCFLLHARWLMTQPEILNRFEELKDQRLGCPCKREKTCHAQTLARLVNENV